MKLTNQELLDTIREEYLYTSITRTALCLKYNVPIRKVYRALGHGRFHVNPDMIKAVQLDIDLPISEISKKYKISEELVLRFHRDLHV